MKKQIRVAVGICFHQNRILMGRRIESESRFAEYWEFPGGKIEEGEEAAEALCREFDEEIGCQVTKHERFQELHWDYPDKKIHLHFFLVQLEHCDLDRFEMSAHSELKWYSLEEAKTERILPANMSVIENLLDSQDQIKKFFE